MYNNLNDTVTTPMVREECCSCHCLFAMSKELNNELRNNKKTFYCPKGHKQYYTGQSEAERLKKVIANQNRSLDFLRTEADTAKKSAAAYKGVSTRLKNRVKNGVCPCCNRHFKNVERHMKTQHPGYVV